MTELLYLQDFDIESCDATISAMKQLEEDGRISLILEQTCFYPRGGGQDWDIGTISNVGALFNVEEIRIDQEGDVHHIGSVEKTGFNIGDTVSCKVNHKRRHINTRLHSAGHVIDMAIDALDLDWIATKGQHYPDLSAVEYTGTWQPEQAEDLRVSIEKKVNELIKSDLENRIVFMPVSEMSTVCRHVPENIPTNKPARVIVYGKDFGVPCGGTHVRNLGQIGSVTIPKLKQKKSVIRVTYTVEGIN